MDFMRSYIELRGNREQLPAFDPPGNIVFLPWIATPGSR
jgi:hypothetical protein